MTKILATPTFIGSLALLIVNDWYLKAQYPGWLTGKLSDFSGLIVVSLIVFSLFPRHIRALAICVSVAFAWWKSPYAQGFIDLVNATWPIQLGRTVDYTDLIALVAIPFCARFVDARDRWGSSREAWRRALAVPVGLIAVLAIAGTSLTPYTRQFSIQERDKVATLSHEGVERVLAIVAGSDEFRCSAPDSGPSNAERICKIDRIWFRYAIKDGRARFRIESYLPLFGRGRRVTRNTDELVEQIKIAFSREYSGLEYVEPLIERTPYRLEP